MGELNPHLYTKNIIYLIIRYIAITKKDVPVIAIKFLSGQHIFKNFLFNGPTSFTFSKKPLFSGIL